MRDWLGKLPLGLNAVIGTAICVPFVAVIFVYYLCLDFWYDELVTLLDYVFVPWNYTVADYTHANNHIFFSFFTKCYLTILGFRELHEILAVPYVLRLPILCISCVTAVYVFILGRHVGNAKVGFLALAVLTTSIPFLNFAVQVRGYAFSMLFSAIIVLHWLRYLEKQKPVDLVMVLLATALILYTIPLNLYLVLVLYGSTALFFVLTWIQRLRSTFPEEERPALGNLLLSMTAGILLGGSLYLPVLDQLLKAEALQASVSIPFLERLGFYTIYLNKMVSGRFVMAILALVGLGLVVAKTSQQRRVVWLMVGCVALTLLMSLVRGDAAKPRFFMNLLPMISVIVAIGCHAFITHWKCLKARQVVIVSLLVLYQAVTFCWQVRSQRSALAADIANSTKTQDIHRNYYQAYFEPRALFAQFKNVAAEKEGYVLYYYFPGDLVALTLYGKAVGVRTAPLAELANMQSPPKLVYVVSAFPAKFEAYIKTLGRGLELSRMDGGVSFWNLYKMQIKVGS